VVSGVRRMNEVNARRGPVSTWTGDRLRAGIPSRYVTSQLGQLSLASFRGRLIEYQLRLGKGGNVTSAGWQVTLCDPMWHVSSRSGVAILRTAMHLLKGKVFPYSLPSVGPGADPGVQAVSPQVT